MKWVIAGIVLYAEAVALLLWLARKFGPQTPAEQRAEDDVQVAYLADYQKDLGALRRTFIPPRNGKSG